MFLNLFNNRFTLENIKIIYNKIEKKNKILDVSKYYKSYNFVLLEENDKIRLIFKPNHIRPPYIFCLNEILFYCESKLGINFTKPIIYQKMHAISSNFSVIKDHINNEYIGVGGRHASHLNQKRHNKINCKCKNENYDFRIKPKNQLNCYKENTLPLIKDNFSHKCFLNGLYILKSDNFFNWKLLKETPVISGFNEGLIGNIYGYSNFDSKCCILNLSKSKKDLKYIIYVRSNVDKAVRAIQYSQSNDLINWDKFKYIDDKNFNYKNDNFYFPNFFKYPDSNEYIGILCFAEKNKLLEIDDGIKKSSIFLVYSNDGIKWHRIYKLLHFTGNMYSICHTHPVQFGLIKSKDNKKFYLYFQNNFGNRNPEKAIYRYEIRKHGFLEGICLNKNLKGILNSKKYYKIKNNIILNFKSKKITSFINIIFIKKNNKNWNHIIKGINDNVNYILNINEDFKNIDVLIKIELFESSFFSLQII